MSYRQHRSAGDSRSSGDTPEVQSRSKSEASGESRDPAKSSNRIDPTDPTEPTERTLRELVGRSPNPMALFDRDSRYLAASRSWEKDWAGSSGLLVGRLHAEAHPELSTHILDAHARVLAGESVTSDGDVVVTPNGVARLGRWSAVPWRRANESDPAGLVASIQDLSSVRRLEAAIIDREVAATIFFEKAATGIVSIAPSGRVQRWNHAYRKMVGRHAAPTGETIESLIHPEDLDDVRGLIDLHLEGGRTVSSLRCRHLDADGRTVWVQQSCSTMHDRVGTPVSVILFVMDLEEQLKLETRVRMQDRLASIGALGSALGHDMNSVLLAIRTHNDVAGQPSECGPAALHANQARKGIVACVDYLQSLSDSLHMLSRSDETSAPTTARSTDVATWWRTTRPLLSKTLHRRCRLTQSIPSTLPWIPMSPHHLTQAVLNLFSNAAQAVEDRHAPKFDKGRVHLEAALENDGDDPMLRIAVADNGVGMPPEVKAQATDAFFTTRPGERGTGLGLALVHELVQQAHGRFEIESTPGVGTTVVLRFPIVETEHAATTADTSDGVTHSDDSGLPTIETMPSNDGEMARPTSEDGRTTKTRRVGGGKGKAGGRRNAKGDTRRREGEGERRSCDSRDAKPVRSHDGRHTASFDNPQVDNRTDRRTETWPGTDGSPRDADERLATEPGIVVNAVASRTPCLVTVSVEA